MADQVKSNELLEQLAAMLKPVIEFAQSQGEVEQYLTSPEIEKAINEKQNYLRTYGIARAQNLYTVLDDLGPYNVISYAWAMYFKARTGYFKSRDQSDRSAVNVMREQEKGSKTGEELDNTFNPEIESKLTSAEWWLETHSKNMDLHSEMAYASAHLVELANDEIKASGKDAFAVIDVDLSEKSFIEWKDKNDSNQVKREDQNKAMGIRALQIDRDTQFKT